jgi:hypothetical protein
MRSRTGPVLSPPVSAHGIEVADEPSAHPPEPRAATAAATPERASHPRWLIVTAAATTVLALYWIGAVALTVNHGFEPGDEGFYLLSYRWWQSTLRTFTGVQFIYGPVFQLLGYNIAGLRVVRLLTVVATMAVFGWAFMGWLRTRRPSAPASWLWEYTGAAAIVATGALAYGWLPLSPGYNDVSMLGVLLAAAIVLRMATHVATGRRIGIGLACAAGPVAVAMVFAKWSSSGLSLAVVAVVAIIVLAPRGWRGVLRVSAWSIAAAAVTVLFVQLFLVSLPDLLSNFLAVTHVIVASTGSPRGLAHFYFDGFAQLSIELVKVHWLLLLGSVLVAVLPGRRTRWLGAVVAAAGVAVSARLLVDDHAYLGGNPHLIQYVRALFVVFIAAMIPCLSLLIARRPSVSGLAAAVRTPVATARRLDRAGWAILAMLLVIPFTQGAGTGNQLYFMSVNCFAPWAALLIALLTAMAKAPVTARGLVAVLLASSVVIAVNVGADGVGNKP